MSNRTITVRRNLEQVKHCVEEALSVVEHDEDLNCAIDDLNQTVLLLTETVLPALKRQVGDPTIARRRV